MRLLPLLNRDWSEIGTVVNIGGGEGALVSRLLRGHARLRGVLFDCPMSFRTRSRNSTRQASMTERPSSAGASSTKCLPTAMFM